MNNLFSMRDIYFPRARLYRSGSTPGTLQETLSDFRTFPYRERHLQCLWADPRHRPAFLKTTEGEPVEVEHPGEWNLEAGPDFLNATLLIGRQRRRVCGDLEIHIHANAWKHHGHAGDARYENVRFHVVYFQGTEIPGLFQIPIQPSLSTLPDFSFENIDTEAYPYSVPVGDFPLRVMAPDQKIQLLESAGEERLRLKAERLSIAMQHREPEQVLWEELLAALGYKNNKSPFRKIATQLPLARIRALTENPDEAYALLLGVSGLLPETLDSRFDRHSRTFIRTLWDFWWRQSQELKESTLARNCWNLAGIRPVNHPARRLMAAAYYAYNLEAIMDEQRPLTEFSTNFWSTRISWKKSCAPTALVGQARADAMRTNILVPWQAATGRKPVAPDRLTPEPMNGIIRQTAHALFGPDHTAKVYRSALARQGLIQIFHDYVITHRMDALKAFINVDQASIVYSPGSLNS